MAWEGGYGLTNWVHGDGVVLDHDLVGARLGELRLRYTELLSLAVEPCCLVGHVGYSVESGEWYFATELWDWVGKI